jgi:LEA14-like dessication related protein
MAAVALTVVATGCSASAIFTQPEVTLENVQIGGLGLSGGTIVVDLKIVNPNRFALSADALDYALALSDPASGSDTSWVDVASGTYDQRISVGARDSARVQIPVGFSYSGLGAAGGSLLRRGTFTYRATGTVHASTPLGARTVPFRKRGTVTMLGTR